MTPEKFLAMIVDPGLSVVAAIGGPKQSDHVRRLLIATALQESNLEHRYQGSPRQDPGPARGWFQFEASCVGRLLRHAASKNLVLAICETCHVVPEQDAIWRALEGHDTLAVAMARFLYWTDARPLPTTQADGYNYYDMNWRPGVRRPLDWPPHWLAATKAVFGEAPDPAATKGV